MAPLSKTIGAFEVTVLCDGPFSSGPETLVHAQGPKAQADLIASYAGRTINFDVNLFALRGRDGVTLIDAGTGPDMMPSLGRSRAVMREAGIAPEAVDRILLTHLHFDHSLGLLDQDRPYFPRAEIFVPAIELAFYSSAHAREALPPPRRGAFPITERMLKAYGDRIKPFTPGEVRPGVHSVSLPGHTMGQTGYFIEGDNETLLFWADALHMGEAQAADPDISTIYDYDPKLAARTRRWLLPEAADRHWLIAGSHESGFRRVRRKDAAFELTPA